jgi:hypothetical protein
VKEKLFTYAPYNAELSSDGLKQFGLSRLRPEDVRKMDSVEFIPELRAVGQKMGEIEVSPAHFDRFPAGA